MTSIILLFPSSSIFIIFILVSFAINCLFHAMMHLLKLLFCISESLSAGILCNRNITCWREKSFTLICPYCEHRMQGWSLSGAILLFITWFCIVRTVKFRITIHIPKFDLFNVKIWNIFWFSLRTLLALFWSTSKTSWLRCPWNPFLQITGLLLLFLLFLFFVHAIHQVIDVLYAVFHVEEFCCLAHTAYRMIFCILVELWMELLQILVTNTWLLIKLVVFCHALLFFQPDQFELPDREDANLHGLSKY